MASKSRRSKSVVAVGSLEKEALEKARLQKVSATCFFNNKGGVGKTTLVANLAAELTLNFGAKILVVDGDPQCNLTQYVLSDEEALDIYSKDNPESIYSIIRPLALGRGYGDRLPIRRAGSFGFDLIIGDPRLALQEDLLAQDWRDARAGGMRGIKTTFVFADVVAKAKALNYDFVFFDMGPSLGAINRSIILAMDHFAVPMSIDIFSMWAVRNIGATIGVWQKELATGISMAEDPSEVPALSQKKDLRFIGYITQQHKERGGYEEDLDDPANGSRKRIVRAYKDIGESFPAEIARSLGKFYNAKVDPHLGDIRHLGSLAPKSQSQHEPMIAVRATGSYTQLRRQARDIYRSIALRYLENVAMSH